MQRMSSQVRDVWLADCGLLPTEVCDIVSLLAVHLSLSLSLSLSL